MFEAASGGIGLQLMRSQAPDVVILDMLLPDMNGWDVLFAMSGETPLGQIPVILMTASVNAADPRNQDYPNLVDRLTKPASVDTLLAAVQRQTSG